MLRLFHCIALMLAALMLVPAHAQTGAPNHIRVKVVAQSAVPRAGGAVTLGIVFTPDPGWHGYWQNPGDAGLGATFNWRLPAGLTVGPPLYPVPQKLVIAGLMNHVYKQEYTLIVQMKLPKGLPVGTPLPVRARGQWLACTDEICVPETGDLAIDLSVGDGMVAPAAQAQFDGFWMKMPRPLGSDAAFQIAGDRVRIGIPYPTAATLSDPWFYASTENAVAYAEPQTITRKGDLLIVETRSGGKADLIEGVLSIGHDKGLAIRAVPGRVAAGGEVVGAAKTDRGLATILLAFGGAVFGGIILNVMPCVFPIISLKALSLAKAGGDERAVKGEALAYACGVILTCAALGGVLLSLRGAGQTVGWAFQLQNPAILFLLLLLAFAITLNMLGVFEVRGFGGGQGLADRGGTSGAFWTGALAAFVATPCTGPFMAAALGAALVLPTVAALAIFAGLGLGLALPFLALGYIPTLRSRMPKPGPWMNTFRRVMAVPMVLTALALLWLLWRQGGSAAIVSAVVALLAVGAIAHLHGRVQRAGSSSPMLAAITGLALVGFGAQAWAVQRNAVPQSSRSGAILASLPFDETGLATLRQQGRPVFLYFTADWCVTCKVNEKVAIERAEVAAAFKKANVAVMVGDWTNGDPAITRFLEAKGRSGVPLYLWYPRGGGSSRELPQVLTPGMLAALAG
jgi:thiol:disulfide interchange protein/DsbC/DsbD-like thiol-disulfide interchange protein